jgi:hypothetical protein
MSRRPEDSLLVAVIDLCRLRGLLVAHFRPAQSQSGRWLTAVQGDGKGYPDLTIVGPGGVMWRELKSATGATSPEQRVWLSALTEAGVDAGVWKPRDLASGRIAAELSALRRSTAVAA